jgi:hypothetical protein
MSTRQNGKQGKKANNGRKSNGNKKNGNTRRNGAINNSVRSTNVTMAPINAGLVVRQSRGRMFHQERFHSSNIGIAVDSNGKAFFAQSGSAISGSATIGQKNLDLGFGVGNDAVHKNVFGTALQTLASIYNRWRVKSLTIRFVSQLSTGHTGIVVVGYYQDPFSEISTYPFVESCEENFRTPVYYSGDAFMNVRNFNKELLYVSDTASANALDRFSSCGALCVAEYSPITTPSGGMLINSFIGTIEISGVMEFCDRRPPFVLQGLLEGSVPSTTLGGLGETQRWESTTLDASAAPLGTSPGSYSGGQLFTINPADGLMTFNSPGPMVISVTTRSPTGYGPGEGLDAGVPLNNVTIITATGLVSLSSAVKTAVTWLTVDASAGYLTISSSAPAPAVERQIEILAYRPLFNLV